MKDNHEKITREAWPEVGETTSPSFAESSEPSNNSDNVPKKPSIHDDKSDKSINATKER